MDDWFMGGLNDIVTWMLRSECILVYQEEGVDTNYDQIFIFQVFYDRLKERLLTFHNLDNVCTECVLKMQ